MQHSHSPRKEQCLVSIELKRNSPANFEHCGGSIMGILDGTFSGHFAALRVVCPTQGLRAVRTMSCDSRRRICMNRRLWRMTLWAFVLAIGAAVTASPGSAQDHGKIDPAD